MGAPHPYFRITSEAFGGHGRKFDKLASQTYTIGGLASFQIGVGTVRPMQSSDIVLGIYTESITSTHDDFANTNPVNVEIIFRGAELFCPVTTGTVALTQLGDEADVLNGGLGLTLTESNNDFRQIALDGSSTNTVYATCINTVY